MREQKMLRKKKPQGYWKNKRNITSAVRTLVEKLGRFPKQKEMAAEHGGLPNAIHESYGGIENLRERLGYKSERIRGGMWNDIGYVIKRAKKLMKDQHLDTLPSQKKLGEMGYSSLSAAISSHGGFYKFRSLIGEEKVREEHGKWKDKKYIVKEAKRLLKDHHLGTLPDAQGLTEIGYGGLSYAIQQYYGGFRAFRKELGENQKKRKDNQLKDRKYVVKQIRRVMKEKGLDTMPSSSELREGGYGSLYGGICKYHGGIITFGQSLSLGQNSRKRADGTWKNLEFTLGQVNEFLEQHPEFDDLPGHSVLIRYIGGPSLSQAIVRHHGGYNAFRQKLRVYLGRISEGDQLGSLLEHYAGERQ